MNRFLTAAIVALVSLGLAGEVSAGIVVGYTSAASTGSLAADAVGTSVSGQALSRGSGISSASGGTYNSNGFSSGTAVSAVTNGDFLTFGFDSTMAYDLTSLGIRYDRSNSGPKAMEIQLNVNGGGFLTIFSDSAISTSGETESGIDLSAFTNVTSAIFRVVAFDASSTGGTFDIENFGSGSTARGISVEGEFSAVPEPSSLTYGLIFALTMFGPRRRR